MKGSAVRRFSKVVIGAAGALLIAPLVVAAQALPASAATGKLVVTTLDRNGHAVPASVEVSTALNSDGLPAWSTSGKTIAVADGQHAVLAGIEQTVNGVTVGTIAETIVTISGTGTTRVTLDARKGHLVKVTLDGKPVSDYIDARVCVGATPASEELFESPGDLYVVPSTSADFSFAYLAQGQGAYISAVTTVGVPASPGGAWTSAQLAAVTLHVRSNEQLGADTQAMLQVGDPPNGITCGTSLSTQETSNTPPYSQSWRVSPGYWHVRTDDVADNGFDEGGYYSNQRFVAGHGYSDTYYAAAWAPAALMFPYIWRHTLNFMPPSFTDPYNQGSDSQTLNHIDLSVNGHFLASDKVESSGQGIVTPFFSPGISTTGWYDLTDTTTLDPGFALPASQLSAKATLAWHFYASPSVQQETPGFWTSFGPAGLSNANSAAPGSQTTVTLRPYRDASNPNVPAPSDTVTKMLAWWSSDGAHWHLVTVTHNTSGWHVTVPNPASGTVSLRAEVFGSHGDTSTETVYKAYAIS